MIGAHIVEFEELQRLSGYKRLADVERWAERIGLPYQRCRAGIWTTSDALNVALGIAPRVDAGLYDADVV